MLRGRLWRLANPELPEADRTQLVADLMRASGAWVSVGHHGGAMAAPITTGAWCAIRPTRSGTQRWAWSESMVIWVMSQSRNSVFR